MQNIKICPKCNQASPSTRNTFCPYDGTPLIEMQPLQNQQRQPLPVIQSPVIATPLPTTKKKMHPSMLGCLLLLGVFILGALLVSVKYNASKSSGKPTPSPNSAPQVQDSLKTAVNSTATPYEEPSSDRLARVNSILKYQGNFTYHDYYFIYSALHNISSDAPEYQEAQKILSQYKKQIESAKQKMAAIPPKKAIAQAAVREPRQKLKDELESLESEDAQLERALDMYENMEGSIGKSSYLNALKKKGELQLRRIQLERKLKKLPR